jgi:hypothetical protein
MFLGGKPVEFMGRLLYRTADGKLIELPEDMTKEQVIQLEADARAALTKIGKGPGPKPVPDVKKLDKREDKKTQLKPFGKGKKAGAGAKGSRKFQAGGSPTLSKVGAGKVAQYLASKAAPIMAKGFARLGQLRTSQQTHDDAGEKRTQAEASVLIPASEGQSKSNSAQVTVVSDRPAPKVDPNKGKQTLQEKLRENVPKSVEDVDNFKRDKKAQHTGAEVLKNMQDDKNAVVGTFQDMGHTPPPAPREFEPEALPPTEAAPGTGAMNLGKDGIAPLQKEHTDLSNYTNDADKKLTEEGVTQEQLDMVDSGDLANANKEKKGMEKSAKEEPIAVQKFAQEQGKAVESDLKKEETKNRADMVNKRKAGLGATRTKQTGTKSALEKKREEVAAKINGIYTTAQDKVKKRLADLETQSMKRFDDGNNKATKEFEDAVNKEIDAFKEDRYSGWFGWARKIRDWIKGIDDLPPVKAIFDRNREKFVATINKLVEDISADNKRVIQECKDELAKARAEIKDYVDKLGPSLKDIGKKAAEEMSSKLDEMDKFVAKREDELQNKLKDKQTAAIKAIDEKIEKMKEAMSGALAKLGRLLLWAAKKFFTWALEAVGFSLSTIDNIINKGTAVLKAIFTKPIRFVKNLVNAAITGFDNFREHFLKHLQDAVFDWLTDSLQGITLPQTWDLKGIISVALQMIGISKAEIRSAMVEVMGEPVVAQLENTFTLLKTLMTEGPMAAWEQLKEMAADLRDAFVQAVKDYVKQKIIEEAVKIVLAIFIPGAGIVKAIIAIYDTIVFFIKKAKVILEMLGNFLGAISEIAAGNISAAADALEKGLARGLVLVINFLATIAKLSGITKAIREGIQTIRGKVRGVLLKVAKWIWEKGKALVSKGVAAAKAGVAKVVQWWKARTKFTAEDGQHTLSVEGTQQKPFVQIASVPQSLRAYLEPRVAPSKWPKVEKLLSEVEDEAASQIKPDEKPEKAQQRVQAKLEALKAELPAALQREIPLTVVVHKPSGGLAMQVIAKPLTKLAGNTSPNKQTSSLEQHSKAAAGQALMQQLNFGQKGGRGWVALHLLSYRLMGPNEWWNLAPGYQAANSAMTKIELDTEEALKKKGEKKIGTKLYSTAIRFYDVTAAYHKTDDPPGCEQFAQTVTIREGIFDPLGKEVEVTTHPEIPSATPIAPGKLPKPNYSTMGGPALNLLLGKKKKPSGGGKFPETIGEMIVKARGKMKEDAKTQEFSYQRLRDYSSKIITDDDVEGLIQLVRNEKADIK